MSFPLCSLYLKTFCIVLQHHPFVPLQPAQSCFWPYIYVLYIQIGLSKKYPPPQKKKKKKKKK